MQIGPVIKEAERLWHTNIQRGLIWRGPGIAPESRQSNLLQQLGSYPQSLVSFLTIIPTKLTLSALCTLIPL